MADQLLTLTQLNSLLQSLTASLTGLSSTSGVRLSWQPNGAPGWKRTDDVVGIRVVPASDPIIQQRDTNYQGDAGDGVNIKVQSAYTRVHFVYWVLYGPSSYDKAESLRNGLYSQASRDTLARSNLYMVLDVPPVIRAPELFNGQWWERCDVSARFNELVLRGSTVPYLASAQVTIVDEQNDREVIS